MPRTHRITSGVLGSTPAQQPGIDDGVTAREAGGTLRAGALIAGNARDPRDDRHIRQPIGFGPVDRDQRVPKKICVASNLLPSVTEPHHKSPGAGVQRRRFLC